jgi:CRISPR/Cas system CSM-associated protein Csm2 small subunit
VIGYWRSNVCTNEEDARLNVKAVDQQCSLDADLILDNVAAFFDLTLSERVVSWEEAWKTALVADDTELDRAICVLAYAEARERGGTEGFQRVLRMLLPKLYDLWKGRDQEKDSRKRSFLLGLFILHQLGWSKEIAEPFWNVFGEEGERFLKFVQAKLNFIQDQNQARVA